MYCKDATRRGDFEHTSFDLLGYTFRGRTVLAKGKRLFIGFNPAMSASATKAVGKKIRDWHLNRRSGTDLSDLARGDQSPGTRLDRLLRGLLSLQAVRHRTAHRPAPGPMGHAEVQATARQDPTGPGVASGCSPTPTVPLCPLAPCRRAPTVGLWELGEGRPSRRVLREPGGEIPPGHSPE